MPVARAAGMSAQSRAVRVLKMKIVCSKCGLGPLICSRALFRDKGALFHSGKSIKGQGPLFCAECAPAKIKRAICGNHRIDAETKQLAA